MKIYAEQLHWPVRALDEISMQNDGLDGGNSLTSRFWPNAVNTGTGNQDIVDDSEDTLATNPRAIFVFHSTIIEHRCLVKTDTSTMNLASKGYFIWMEIVPARSPQHLSRHIAKDVLD